MRQFFTRGFWLSILSLAALTFGLIAFTGRDDTGDDTGAGDIVEPSPDDAVLEERERNIDLIALIFGAQADPGFAIVDGATTGLMRFGIDGLRYMDVPVGTPGENRCAELDQLARCAVAADLLGEAVLWFSIVPLGEGGTVTLPAVVEVLDGNRAALANGWVVARADVLKRECDDDTNSLRDFIRRYGEAATSTFDIDEQRLVSVSCPPPIGGPAG